jgi:hypothetical protein
MWERWNGDQMRFIGLAKSLACPQGTHNDWLGLVGMATIRENNQAELRGIMKKLLALSFLIFLTAGPALSQTQQNEPDSHADSRHHLSYGLIGLTGLLGLLGLRRPKSIEHQRMAAAGVKVSTVPVHLPEHS